MAPAKSGETGTGFDDPGLKVPVPSGVLICENGVQLAPFVTLSAPRRRSSNGGSIPYRHAPGAGPSEPTATAVSHL